MLITQFHFQARVYCNRGDTTNKTALERIPKATKQKSTRIAIKVKKPCAKGSCLTIMLRVFILVQLIRMHAFYG